MHATEFTPLSSTIGGMLIGLAAVLLMLFDGRIAGISGILARLYLPYRESDPGAALAFVLGLMAAPLVVELATGRAVPQLVSSNAAVMIIAGLLVGFGTVYGNGCTSGHGVCGLSRLSPRSVVATAIFMLTAFATVFITRHVLGA